MHTAYWEYVTTQLHIKSIDAIQHFAHSTTDTPSLPLSLSLALCLSVCVSLSLSLSPYIHDEQFGFSCMFDDDVRCLLLVIDRPAASRRFVKKFLILT